MTVPVSREPASGFADRVLAWWHSHGRKDLPWQRRPTPYRVWISEVMLQQTQVATVTPYFRRFVARLPGVRALAGAPIDDVLALWSGLGYYARARNLHRASGLVVERHRGRFPRSLEALTELPGIGRSTAGAILSLACGQRAAILDGNVKRVLCRHAGVSGWPGESVVQRELWTIAEARLPHADFAAYTQAMMDLGATTCTTRAPACGACPVNEDCHAHARGLVDALPSARPCKAIPQRAVTFVLARDGDGRVLLERRPPAGIWGGLWGPPECATPDEVPGCLARLGLAATGPALTLAPVQHTFSHFRLQITPIVVDVAPACAGAVADAADLRWVVPGTDPGIGLAAPVARLVASCATGHPRTRPRGHCMSRTVNCARLGREAEGLDFPPYPGDLGQRIFDEISKEAWQQWLAHQTMLINENRISPMDPDARKFLVEQMQKFLFEGGADKPEGYVPPER